MTDVDTYRERYLAPLQGRRTLGQVAAPPGIESRYCYMPHHAGSGKQDRTLTELYTAGVECGHTEAREELKRRVAAADVQSNQSRAIRDRAQDDREDLASELLNAQREARLTQLRMGELETALTAARARIEALESSTTWRATAPVRAVAHRTKVAIAEV